MKKQFQADIGLLLVTAGWGASFILTKESLAELPTFNFLAIRFFIAFFISSIFFIKHIIKIDKKTLKYGFLLGIILYANYAFQTVGLRYTTASKSAFITGFYVILVPVFSHFITRIKLDKKAYISVPLAFVGLALLSVNGSISGINIGDVYTLICSIFNALYIIYVGKYTSELDSISFAVVQIGVVGLLSMLTSFAVETPTIHVSSNVWIYILILSVICTSGAYIVQNIAQKYTTDTHTALIYTAEPVFGGIFAYILLGESLGIKGISGAALIVIAMLISELNLNIVFHREESSQSA